MLLLLIAFLSGVLTVLAPCILPLLPVIVGGSISGGTNRRRAYVVSVSLAVSVIVFTLILKVSTAFIGIPQYVWEWISGGILIALGVATIFPALWEKLPLLGKISIGSNKVLSGGYMKQSISGDVLVGAALGPVFTTCSPTYFVILATVLPAGFLMGLVDLLAYTAGLTLTLLIIALAGQKVVDRLGLVADPRGMFRRSIGVLFVLIGVLIFTGTQRIVETWLLNHVFDVTKLEQKLLEGRDSSAAMPVPGATFADAAETEFPTPAQKAVLYPKAPELVMPDGYINTAGEPITVGQFKGKKVVLLDIWTYSCINCQRTLPYLKAWYDKYHDQGLEIIAVHTPEFAFEHVYNNVLDAVNKFGIKYPVVLDNEYRTWNAYGNQFWPRKYLIDIDGYIVFDHAGEGSYAETEMQIQRALAERTKRLGMQDSVAGGVVIPADAVTVDSAGLGSPETYFGAARNEYLGNGKKFKTGLQTLIVPKNIYANTLYLGGAWNLSDESAEAQSAGTIVYKYKARDVYFVASAKSGSKVTLLLDGAPIGNAGGADVANGTVMIKENRLYHLVHTSEYGQHTLEIKIDSAGLDAYTFTFG